MNVIVDDVRPLTPEIKAFVFRRRDGGKLPCYSAGAHINVNLTTKQGVCENQYSLISFGIDPASVRSPDRYLIAVRRDPAGRGGSNFMHDRLKVGDELSISEPLNNFGLDNSDHDVIFLAGGIGITPIISLYARSRYERREAKIVYCGRTREEMAYVGETRHLAGDDLILHVDSESGGFFDIPQFLFHCHPRQRLYICGPAPFMNAIIETAIRMEWSHNRIHIEQFGAPSSSGKGFEIVLRRAGKTLFVPEGRSILDILEGAGIGVFQACRRGDCGACQVAVLEGEIDHRDHFLSASERETGRVLQACVSRATGSRLTLDL